MRGYSITWKKHVWRPSSIWTMMSLVKRETDIVLKRILTTPPTTKHPGQNKASQIVHQIFKELLL